jgi:TPR repeat protein
MKRLGEMYFNGRGVIQDYKTALKWYQLAADQGDVAALNHLGNIFFKGQGVIQNYKTALKWYQRIADQGDAGAQYLVADMYFNGQGVVQDYTRAHMWWNIAASQGHKVAAESRRKVEKKMTPTQVGKAQDLARECVAKNYKGC